MPSLPALLSWAWIAFTIEVDNAVEKESAEKVGRRFRTSLAFWTNALRFIDQEGITVAELQKKAGATCNLGGLERWGWIAIGDAGTKRREGYGTRRNIKNDSVLRPTRSGVYLRRIWPLAIAEVEQKWRARFDAQVIDDLRSCLLSLTTPMPASPPEVHPSDGFYTHVISGDIARDDDPPLSTLLGQVLTKLTLDHEDKSDVSLVLSANFLRVIEESDIRIRDLPELTGLSKEGVAMASGFLERHHFAQIKPNRSIALTSKGLDAYSSYQQLSQAFDNVDLRKALDAMLSQQSELSKGLIPLEGGWREEKPYISQTRRLVADPLAALPWQPMVLHRGGWPDAS